MLRRSRQRLICATRDNIIFESLNDLGKNIYPPIYEKPNHRYCPWMNSIIIEEENESIVEILKIKSQYTCSRILRWSKRKKKSILQFFVSQRSEKLDDESGTFIRRIFSVGIAERKKEREATNARATTNSNNQTEQTVRLNRANRSPLVDQRIYASINTWPVTRVRRSQYIEIDPN